MTKEPTAEKDAARLSRLLFEARELIDMLHDMTGGRDQWAARVRDEIDAYRAERGWSPDGFGGESPIPPAADKEAPQPDAENDAPQHGDRSQCLECGGRVHYVEHSQWAGTHYEVLDAWWAHDVHPGDGHDARPGVLPPGGSDA